MELEIYEALTAVNVPADKARAVVESINKEIDKRYALHADKLATRGDLLELHGLLKADLADAKVEIIKWAIGSIFVAVGLFATLVKVWA
ncbi:hypothetical protein [Methylobacillus sp.]|uniref:hypothetical protein n=1 Tax=Methylobacillus sp. TaxID=56818 RepID=UPI002FE3C38E